MSRLLTLLRRRRIPITYLLRDQFITTAEAPLTSPRTAEPGPGTLTLVDPSNARFSIANGELVFPAPPFANWNQGFYGASVARKTGRAIKTRIEMSNHGTGIDPLIFRSNAAVASPSGAPAAIHITSDWIAFENEAQIGGLHTAPSDGSAYGYAIVLRSAGAFFLYEPAPDTWDLTWVGVGNTTATLYPGFVNYNATGVIDFFALADLPAPWSDDYGIATQRLAGARSDGEQFVHEADALIEYTVTALPTSGTLDVNFRSQDATNCWKAQVTSTGDLGLYEVVSGSATLRGSAAGVIANGDRIVIVADDTTIKVYEANNLRITYASATNFLTATLGSISLGADGAVSDLVTWPRTISGAALAALKAV